MSKRACPNCHEEHDTFLVVGTLVTGQVSVRLGSGGRVQAVGPIKPKSVIKPGKELSGKFYLTCPACGHANRPDTFTPVMVSALSGMRADTVYTIGPLQHTIPLHTSELGDAVRLFAAQTLGNWHLDGEIEQLLAAPPIDAHEVR